MPKMSNELLKATDINSTTAINAYKAWTNRMYNLLNLVMAKHGDTWGIFSPATFTHLTFVTRQHAYFGPGPRIEGFSFHQSLETWVGQRVNSTEWKDTNHGAPPHLIDACTTMMCGHPPAVPTDY